MGADRVLQPSRSENPQPGCDGGERTALRSFLRRRSQLLADPCQRDDWAIQRPRRRGEPWFCIAKAGANRRPGAAGRRLCDRSLRQVAPERTARTRCADLQQRRPQPGRVRIRGMALGHQLLRPQSDHEPERPVRGVRGGLFGDHRRRSARFHPSADAGRSAFLRGDLVRNAAQSLRGRGGRQGGVSGIGRAVATPLWRASRHGSQHRSPAARAAGAGDRREHAVLVLQ